MTPKLANKAFSVWTCKRGYVAVSLVIDRQIRRMTTITLAHASRVKYLGNVSNNVNVHSAHMLSCSNLTIPHTQMFFDIISIKRAMTQSHSFAYSFLMNNNHFAKFNGWHSPCTFIRKGQWSVHLILDLQYIILCVD